MHFIKPTRENMKISKKHNKISTGIKHFYNILPYLMSFLMMATYFFCGCTITNPKGLNEENGVINTRQLFSQKCSKCHELPEIEKYPYSPEEWAKIIDSMLEAKGANQYISSEEAVKIKDYIRGLLSLK